MFCFPLFFRLESPFLKFPDFNNNPALFVSLAARGNAALANFLEAVLKN
jgi:hypothetical protein